jgi:hypothetical protein
MAQPNNFTVANYMTRCQRTLVILLEDFGGESLEQWRHKRPDFCPMPLSTFLPLAIDITDIAIFNAYLNKLFLCYLFYEYAQAVENSAIAENYLPQMTATFAKALYYFYASLSKLAIYPEYSTQSHPEILKKVALRLIRRKGNPGHLMCQ